MKYKSELIRSMNWLAKKRDTIFLGQACKVSGHAISSTLTEVPDEKRIELPVFEDVQTGISIGLALNGILPISTYPRFDFFLLGFNQLINHLDKISIISKEEFNPKVIIRVLVGAKKPLDAGEQHTQNYIEPLRLMCKKIKIYDLTSAQKVVKSYDEALKSSFSSVMVEYSEKF